MNKNLKDVLDQPIAKFFRGKHFAFVGTVNKDGSPQVTPTWIDLREDGKLLINTAEGRIRQKNVSRDPAYLKTKKREVEFNG